MQNFNNGWNNQPVPQFMDDRISVADQAEAEGYVLFPGNIIHLWHRTEPIIYERKKDINGREYPMVIMRYTAEKLKTREELQEERIRMLEDLVKQMSQKGETVNE